MSIEAGPTWADFVAAWPLFRDPVLCATAAGAVLGYLGVFIVLRRMVFLSATLSQSAGLGVALAFYLGIHHGLGLPPFFGALLASLGAAALASLRPERLKLGRDTILAFAWLVSAGGAVLIGDRITQEAHDIAGILFGTAVLVSPADLYQVLTISGLALGIGLSWQRGLVFASFDPEGARVQQLPVAVLDGLLVLLITATVSASTRALGALPVFAFSVLPAVAALLISPRLGIVFPLALLGGALSGVGGYLLAFFYDLPVGASEAAVAVLLVLLAAPFRLLRR